jgi:hypothetical protein
MNPHDCAASNRTRAGVFHFVDILDVGRGEASSQGRPFVMVISR